ncbi:DoxX family protein [Craterilacuibacter sp.]|uniref:DoxX family protein n=1 Tax=Craterilacuibacter sp. TaxID=2870909 RepID=UPI003F33CB0E
MSALLNLAGRILLAQFFIIAGIGKITAYAGTEAYMQAYHVPTSLLPLVILLEVGGGLAILLGWKVRWIAPLLAVFSILAALIFHHDFGDQTQWILFLGDLSTAGGLLLLAQAGALAPALDARQRRY